MKILLLQQAIHLPTYGGGNKANRLLLEGLAGRGHECHVLCPALTTRGGPTTREELLGELDRRGILPESAGPALYRFRLAGVEVEALDGVTTAEHRQLILRRIGELEPDAVLVSDDKHQILLEAALDSVPNRVVLLVHTLMHLPFGPQAQAPGEAQTALYRRVDRIVTVSRFVQGYLRQWAGLEASVLPFPVYGPGPFPLLGRFGQGWITLVNPCAEKGLDIFLDLARRFPEAPFAAVPTWGAGEEELAILGDEPNVRLLAPADDLGEILTRTRVLLVPSLIPETFGYVATEAMLRGIPVLASDIGGLPEATHGVGRLLPPESGAWAEALARLLSDPEAYREVSQASWEAAGRFAAGISLGVFEELFASRPGINARATLKTPGEPDVSQEGIASGLPGAVLASPGIDAQARGVTIAIVDPYAGGDLLAPELAQRGCRCLAVQSGEIPAAYEGSFRPGDFSAVLRHHGDMAETAAKLRAEGVDRVIAGGELGVPLADLLAEALGLPGNDPALRHARCDKHGMHLAAARSGLRVPAHMAAGDPDEILAWTARNGRWPLVVKPLHSSGSDGVTLCWSEEEVLAACGALLGRRNLLDRVNERVLVQEYVEGTEYVVDTVSHAGHHRVAAFWRYHRSSGELGYDGLELLPWEGERQRRLAAYAAAVLDALGIRHGPAHGEILWSHDGPVLVEVGARLHGGRTPLLSRQCLERSQLDLAVDELADPEGFSTGLDLPYRRLKHLVVAFLTPQGPGRLRSLPRLAEVEALPSLAEIHIGPLPAQPVPRVAGWLALIQEDEAVVAADLRRLRELEDAGLYEIEEGD